jgi:hypothetical protein
VSLPDNLSALFADIAIAGFPAIVTSFHLEVRDTFSAMKSSTFMWPLSEYEKVMTWTLNVSLRNYSSLEHVLLLMKVSEKCDNSVESVAISLFPPGSKEPVIMAHFVTFQNTEEAAAASLSHIDNSLPSGAVMEAPCQPTSLFKEYEDQANANPNKHRYSCDNAYIDNNADIVEVLREAFTTLPANTKAFSLWYNMAPCSRRKLPDMALSMQSDHYLALYTIWDDANDDSRCQKWVKDVMTQVEKHSVGAYLGDSDFQVRRTRFWEDAEGKKLMGLRRKWDPQGIICGYLDVDDKSGTLGLKNIHEWQNGL